MKKRLLAVLLTAAMVLGMTACGSKSNSGSSDKKEEAQSTDDIKECTIKFQYWADNTDYSSLMQDIIKKFNEENKYGITVEGEEVPWDGGGYSNTLFNAAMGGGAPDVATFKLSATPMFTNNNLLADLTPYVDAWDKKDDISGKMEKTSFLLLKMRRCSPDMMQQSNGVANLLQLSSSIPPMPISIR